MNWLSQFSILLWAQGECTGPCTQGLPRILLDKDECPDLPEYPARKCLSLQTWGLQGKVAVLVFAGIQNAWRWGKKRKSYQRWDGQVPAAQRCAALSQHHHAAQAPGHWCEPLAGSPRFCPAVCPESQQVLFFLVTNSFYAGSMVISCGHKWEAPSLHTTL